MVKFSTVVVSIHALLAECDGEISRASLGRMRFNPRTPCGVRPPPATPPGQRASFNPRTPCGVRRNKCTLRFPHKQFQSTHSLRSATIIDAGPNGFRGFQSTHSLRSATRTYGRLAFFAPVSIHALLAECDYDIITRTGGHICFNPRTPCGVRPAYFADVTRQDI